MKARSYFFLVFIILCRLSLDAQISGTVFRDFNGNGTKDSNETFVNGVTINAYNASGTLCGTTTTSGNIAPNYSLSGCGTSSTRVEFVLPTSGICVASEIDYSSLNGSIYGTSVHFVNGNSTDVNFAINNPGDFNKGTSGVNVYIPCYVNGDPLPSGSTSGSREWFVGFPYTSSGTVAPAQKLTGEVIGSTWGVAYSKQANKVFTSAFLKRHVGLGAMGSGGIYMLDPTATTFNVTQFFDMDNNTFNVASNPTTRTRANSGTYGIGNSFNIISNTEVSYLGAVDPITNNPNGLGIVGSNSDRGLDPNPFLPNFDPAAFDQVGKVGLGDIDISDDGRFLYVTNLYQRKVFRLELNNPLNPTSVIGVVAIDLPNTTCNNGVLRPFGLKFTRSKLYIGAICTGENGGVNNIGGSTDMQAYVFSVDSPTAVTVGSSTSVLSYDLNYIKGFVRSGVPGTDRWYPWTNDASVRIKESCCGEYMWPQPILSDIEFNERGDIIMSFVDRWGHQYGQANYIDLNSNTTLGNGQIGGDIIISGVDCTSNTYNLESNGSYTSNGVVFSGGVGNSQGIGGGEFYRGEFFSGAHEETSMGGLAQVKGSDELYFVAMDPLNIRTGGVIRLSNTNGNQITGSAYQLYSENNVSNFGKANGLGDIELSGFESPIEIGNRVWFDTDNDGIQDAGEAPIAGVTVQLLQGTTVIGTATTDASGNYYFSNNSGTSTASSIYGITQLMPNMSYIVRIPNVQGGSKQAALGTNSLTLANIGGAGQPDVRDSDGTFVGNNAEVTVLTSDIGVAGANNHNFDFGFSAVTCVTPTATVASTNPTCSGSTAQSNGVITISGFTAGQRYQYTSGATFTGTAIPASITAIPVGGVIVSNLANTTQQYTVRIYDATDNTCFIDRTVSITAVSCGDCNCKEYLYLNDTGLGEVHKFAVNADGSITEIGSPWMSGFANPHGLGSDLNGYLYIGDDPTNGPIKKVTCDGQVIDATWNTTIVGGGLTNIGSIGNYIFVNGANQNADFNKIHVLDACSGDVLGSICFNGTDGTDWGMQVLPDGTILVSHGLTLPAFPGFTPKKVFWKFQFNESMINGACIDPLISSEMASGSYLNAYREIWGVTTDGTHLYAIAYDNSNNTILLKINATTGAFVAQQIEGGLNGSGYQGARGLVYAPSSNRLYVAGFEDCLSIVNPSNLSYIGPGNGVIVDPNSEPKAIGIVKECCPNTDLTFNETVCSSGNGEKFYLQDFINCGDGIICEGMWSVETPNANHVFNSCDLSITVNGSGCGTYVLEKTTGATGNQQCGAFRIEVTICTEVAVATISASPGTCTGSTPNNNAVINITAAMNANQAGISTGATYSGPAYNGAGTITITGGTASFTGRMHNTQYTIRIFNGANDCYTDYTVTTPTIACCALTVVCTPQPQTNCNPVNGSASVVASNAVGTVTYLWSSGEVTSTISNKAAGTYTVTVTDGGVAGCTRTCQAVISSTVSLPTATCTPTPNTNCITPNGQATVTTNGNQILWSTGGNTATITGLASGTYTVTVTNTTTGCTNTCQAVVNNATVNPTCNIIANTQPSCANLTGGSITVSPSPAGTYTYNWSDIGSGSAMRTGLSGGTYTVTVTNSTTNCTGVCNIILTTPTNCCNINAITAINLECLDNGTPTKITDNRIRFSATVTNTNALLTSFNVTINGGTTITPNTNVSYGVTQFTLGAGTAGGGATFTVTVTDSATPGCTQTFQVVDPGTCIPATPECPPVKCGTTTIQVNGN